MRMNSALGKEVLALVRDGDYAHAGEEEAIRLALSPISKGPQRQVLDAGCGRGGTARYVQDQGWGRVSGFDLEGESIQRAQALHPDLTFAVCDVLDVSRQFSGKFDLIYAFNAFYAFPDPHGALQALRAVAGAETKLVIFDYVAHPGFAGSDFSRLDEASHWKPIQVGSFGRDLKQSGWNLKSTVSLDAEYVRWYGTLVRRIDEKQKAIEALAGKAGFQYVRKVYGTLLEAVLQKTLGGAIFHANAAQVLNQGDN